jgi:hypothetical protein
VQSWTEVAGEEERRGEESNGNSNSRQTFFSPAAGRGAHSLEGYEGQTDGPHPSSFAQIAARRQAEGVDAGSNYDDARRQELRSKEARR